MQARSKYQPSFLEVRIEIESDLQTLQKYISIYLLFLSIYSYFHRSTKSIYLEICFQAVAPDSGWFPH